MNQLIYTKRARKAEHGYDGLLYLHTWKTGYQYLIFKTPEHADRWAAVEGEPTEVQHEAKVPA